jgi:molybdate transport system permease protein
MDQGPLYLSVKLAIVATAWLLCLAIPVSYCMVYQRFRGFFLVESIVGLPLVLPPTVLGFFLLTAMGPASVIGRGWESLFGGPLVFTFYGIVVAAIMQSLPFAVQPIKTAFEKIDYQLVETSYVLGASHFETFYRVILPNARGGLVAAAILSFAHIMGECGRCDSRRDQGRLHCHLRVCRNHAIPRRVAAVTDPAQYQLRCAPAVQLPQQGGLI